jgi:transglutaminase-like putative cysteine protease
MKGLIGIIVSSVVVVAIVVVGVRAAEAPASVAQPMGARSATYQVTHTLSVNDLPATAAKVQVWFWLPDDDANQKLLDLTVREAPAGYRITRDPGYGHRYLYAEVDHPRSGAPLTLATDFIIRRSAASVALDADHAGALTDIHRAEFAEYLRRDVPNMQTTDALAALASEICGSETNVVKQARLLFDYVVDHTSHYSKAGAPKSSGKGSAEYCLANKGGSCTDMHSLFIAMARARGIPTRLQFGSLLKPANEGKEMDPGYRCWVEYFVPSYGWVPMDIAAANTNADKRDFYFSGIDERRIRFSEGRGIELSPRQAGDPLNLMIIAYVEVDGKPLTSFKRVLKYTEIKSLAAAGHIGAAVKATP